MEGGGATAAWNYGVVGRAYCGRKSSETLRYTIASLDLLDIPARSNASCLEVKSRKWDGGVENVRNPSLSTAKPLPLLFTDVSCSLLMLSILMQLFSQHLFCLTVDEFVFLPCRPPGALLRVWLYRLNPKGGMEGRSKGAGYYYILRGTESWSFSLCRQTHSALFRPQQALSRPSEVSRR